MSYPLGLSWMLLNGFKNNPTKGLFLVRAGKIFLVCQGRSNPCVSFHLTVLLHALLRCFIFTLATEVST